jgi:hypothetical protein
MGQGREALPDADAFGCLVLYVLVGHFMGTLGAELVHGHENCDRVENSIFLTISVHSGRLLSKGRVCVDLNLTEKSGLAQ